jgi:hypothetical protein
MVEVNAGNYNDKNWVFYEIRNSSGGNMEFASIKHLQRIN